jgi:hypothetical protein
MEAKIGAEIKTHRERMEATIETNNEEFQVFQGTLHLSDGCLANQDKK